MRRSGVRYEHADRRHLRHPRPAAPRGAGGARGRRAHHPRRRHRQLGHRAAAGRDRAGDRDPRQRRHSGMGRRSRRGRWSRSPGGRSTSSTISASSISTQLRLGSTWSSRATRISRRSRRSGVVYLNPGSAGPRRFKLPITLATVDLSETPLRPEVRGPARQHRPQSQHREDPCLARDRPPRQEPQAPAEIIPLTLREPCPCCGGPMRIIEMFQSRSATTVAGATTAAGSMTLRPSPWPIRPRIPIRRRSTGCLPAHRHPPDCGPNRPHGPTKTPDIGGTRRPPRTGVTRHAPVPDDRSANRQRSFPIDSTQPHAASSLGGFPTRAEVAPAPTLTPRPASENLHRSRPGR